MEENQVLETGRKRREDHCSGESGLGVVRGEKKVEIACERCTNR